ncbi:AMIN domain-containing protein [Nostoc sp. TCL26-01]|uniref:AMIN domain-containing protein n=1 Tax=Nostoc sp. TCL26-01 TaxID=2576904 RepID=UPI0015BD3E9A|nr:AMIN domain-containing protein [Nostoc sp. TCL26-01]QLE54462.1 AMIN domain-containing protein [Nostoc sp. TCL26-01]
MSKAMTSNNIQGSKLLFSAGWCVAIASIALVTNSGVATAQVQLAKLNNWRFSPGTKKLEITLSSGKTPQYFYLAEPPRLVVDIPDTKLGSVSTMQNYTGAIQRVRVSQLSANVTRIVLDLAPGFAADPNQVQLQPVSKQNPTRWVLRPAIAKSTPKPENSQRSATLGGTPSASTSPQNNSNYLQLPSTIPAIGGTQQPFVTVPPLTSNQTPANINASFPPTATTPPNNPLVIEFGQPIPK